MSSTTDSNRCWKERAQAPPSLFQNGKIVIQAHHVGWIVTGCFTIVAIIVSFWLIDKHLRWYTNKKEQRYVVRILFMVPLYAIISLASYLWWNHATPLILIRDCYESTVLTAFFYLLLIFLSPDPDEQRLIFLKYGLSRHNDAERIKKGESVQKWVFPLWFLKWKPSDGLYFLQLMKWGILQYCALRPLTTLIAIILDYVGLYCESSWGLGWGHIYITIVVSLSVTLAMYCLIQLYVAVSKKLVKHKPLLKLFAIKAVVFLTFWQATFLSVLTMFGVVKDTEFMTAEDINIGIGALLETLEMALFAFLHIRAFTYIPYKQPHGHNSDSPAPKYTPRLKSLGHAMDFRETFRELWAGCVYMWHKSRGKPPQLDQGAARVAYYETAFGKRRPTQAKQNFANDRSDASAYPKEPTFPMVQVHVDEQVEVNAVGEKQWLGIGDDYGYGLRFLRKERSESLENQIEKELKKRGYTLHHREASRRKQSKNLKERSWWRSIRDRFSTAGQEEQLQMQGYNLNHVTEERSCFESRLFQPKRFPRDNDARQEFLAHSNIRKCASLQDQDLPPPGHIRTCRHDILRTVDGWRQSVDPYYSAVDVPTTLPVSSGYIDSNHPGRGDRECSVDAVRPLVLGKILLEDIPNSVLAHAAQSEISVDCHYSTKPTLPVLISEQPEALFENQQEIELRQPSIPFDEDSHVPLMADAETMNYDEYEHEHSAIPLHAHSHRRESAHHRPRPRVTSPSRPTSRTAIQQSLKQIYYSSSPQTDTPCPSSVSISHSSPPRRGELRETRYPGQRIQRAPNTSDEPYSPPRLSSMEHSLYSITHTSTSPINEGLSRYAPHT